jgi:hypothetical protein
LVKAVIEQDDARAVRRLFRQHSAEQVRDGLLRLAMGGAGGRVVLFAHSNGRAVRHDEDLHGSDALPHQPLQKVAAEMALAVLVDNLIQVMKIVGIEPLIAAIAA